MNPQDYICKVMIIPKMVCDGCEEEIVRCDECKNTYFGVNDFVGCMPDNKHICSTCFEEWVGGI